jgi:hypothetical protein
MLSEIDELKPLSLGGVDVKLRLEIGNSVSPLIWSRAEKLDTLAVRSMSWLQ